MGASVSQLYRVKNHVVKAMVHELQIALKEGASVGEPAGGGPEGG